MDYEKLATAIRLCGREPSVKRCEKECAYYKGGDTRKCIPRMTKDAATAIAELLVENQALRNAANGFKGRAEEAENAALRQMCPVKLDETGAQALALAAEVSELRQKLAAYENIGSVDRLQELAQADREGRCVVLPSGGCSDAAGENALKSAMNTCFYHNNPVTRYIADAVAEKLTREEAEAALKEADG